MQPYRAFLVRCWWEGSEPAEQPPGWRYAVVEIGREPRAPRGFADLEGLVLYLSGALEGKPLDERPMIPEEGGKAAEMY